jgi:uncharacterized membrane protein YqjE
LPGQFFALLEDQIDLASLEWQFEKSHSLKRIGALVFAVFLAFAAFVFIQVAIIAGIVATGRSIWLSALILAGVYLIIAILLLWKFGRRDPKAGSPFHGTRQEFRKNLKWIQQIFS